MRNTAAELDAAIKAVCPILGVSIGRMDDRSTWRVDFAPEATEKQREAAIVVVDEFDPETSPAPPQDLESLQAEVNALAAKIGAAIASLRADR